MKRFWGICAAGLLLGVLALGFGVQAGAESEEHPDSTNVSMEAEVTDEELDEVLANQPGDWHEWELTRAQEQALKMRLHRQGVLPFDTERTSEQEKQFRYITRLVPINSEAVPEGSVYNLMVGFKAGTTDAEVAAVLADLGDPKIVREWRMGDHLSLYLWLSRNDITMHEKPDDIAEILRRDDKEISREYNPVTELTKVERAPPPHPYIDAVSADPFTSRIYNVRRHMISIEFRKNPTSEELHAFELRNRLTEARNRKEFFILRDIPVAQAINEIWNDSLVWNAHAVKGGPLRIRGTMGELSPRIPTG